MRQLQLLHPLFSLYIPLMQCERQYDEGSCTYQTLFPLWDSHHFYTLYTFVSETVRQGKICATAFPTFRSILPFNIYEVFEACLIFIKPERKFSQIHTKKSTLPAIHPISLKTFVGICADEAIIPITQFQECSFFSTLFHRLV